MNDFAIFSVIDRRGQILLDSLYLHAQKFLRLNKDQVDASVTSLVVCGVLVRSAPRGAKQKVILYFTCEESRLAYRGKHGRD